MHACKKFERYPLKKKKKKRKKEKKVIVCRRISWNGHFGKRESLKLNLTLKAPFTTIVAFVLNVGQDQAAQNVQSDL